ERFKAICERERCPFAVVGEATEEAHLTVTDSHFGNNAVDMPLNVLLGKAPRMHRSATRENELGDDFDASTLAIDEAVTRVLHHPAVASKSFLITIGDRTITGLVARDQMVGPWQVPVADCAVTATSFDVYTGEAMAMGERTPLALLDAAASGRMAIGETLTNLAASRINAISDIKLSANWMSAAGHPGEDARLYDTVKAVGMELCPELGITIPVGKDSMSMKTQWRDEGADKSVTSPLSLVVTGFAPVSDIRKTLTPQLRMDKGETDLILIDLGRGQNRLGASILTQVYSKLGSQAPDVDDAEDLKAFFAVIQGLNADGHILAYHDRSDGGLLVTALEMAFAGHCGLNLYLDALAAESAELAAVLFNEELGAVIQVHQDATPEVLAQFSAAGLGDCVAVIGQPVNSDDVAINFGGQPVFAGQRHLLQRQWAQTSYQIQRLRDNVECADQEFDGLLEEDNPGLSVKLGFDVNEDISAPYIRKGVRPQIAVLREQGVNGQVEMAAAFDRAGFNAIDVHMSDILSGRVSLDAFKGLVACGGFSYGDVLGAGEGWAKSVLFNSRARDGFQAFFERKDSFALGVCNGCQMMSNLHELIPGSEFWPHFVRNRSEQFEARVAMVQVQESASIFLQGMAGSRMPIAIAHGEGHAEFESEEALLEADLSGCVAMRFIDNHGKVTETYPANPNGSPRGITGLTSRDGRVTIMMPHPERVFRAVQNSWKPDDWQDDAGWLRMFRNARVWVD
ncbi:MAG: phosphoribosylformylglycinamidine synthase, partial [Gammaproteobacteria bacterium]|nr:phosphoribosylformylglycinamidine synthase [Gammaproteobacteria bacterium]